MKIQISLSRTGQTITYEMYRQAKGNKGVATIVMNPHDFITLTTPDQESIQRIMDSAQTIEAYNEYARTKQSIHLPWLDVTLDGKIRRFGGGHRPSESWNCDWS